ncbi:MAG: LamG domain-containing protein [Gammaproteobacteria bacterium]|nr:LamG domain-containing protein [Gammaproteobacteria bacterium]
MPGLIVNGTITRTKVAPGADLVAYSGFSTRNYLEQPYNPDLDFGTGDFCIMGWVNIVANGAASHIISRGVLSSTAGMWTLFKNASDVLQFNIETTSVLTASISSGLHFVSIVRVGGVVSCYIDGVQSSSASNTTSITNTSAVLVVGNASFSRNGPFNGSLALWRISATAPTAEQIAKIYNDEKVLFQENAQATLYGTSDAVTALAHDPDTDLLHVGTSAGRSVFRGLERIQNTTTSVSKAISASGGLVAEK